MDVDLVTALTDVRQLDVVRHNRDATDLEIALELLNWCNDVIRVITASEAHRSTCCLYEYKVTDTRVQR